MELFCEFWVFYVRKQNRTLRLAEKAGKVYMSTGTLS